MGASETRRRAEPQDRHARILARTGVILFAASLVNGFLIHLVTLQRQALSAHLVGLIGAVFLISVASLWKQLALTEPMSRAGTFLGTYGFCAGWLLNFLAALTGRFGVFPLSTAVSQGHTIGDILVSAGLLSVALALLAFAAIVFRGLSKRQG